MMNVQEMTKEQLVALVTQMKADGQRKLTCKVSEKGAISVYGLGRFPVTLYIGQWEKLTDFIKADALGRSRRRSG